jgi:hypothetical protein
LIEAYGFLVTVPFFRWRSSLLKAELPEGLVPNVDKSVKLLVANVAQGKIPTKISKVCIEE